MKIKKIMIARPEIEVSVIGIKGIIQFLKALPKVYIHKVICWTISNHEIARTHVLVIPKIRIQFVKEIKEDGRKEVPGN